MNTIILLSFLVLSSLSQITTGDRNCCQSSSFCGNSDCCNQCQIRCRTTYCLNECRQDCCSQSSCCQESNCCQSSNCCQGQDCCQGSNCCQGTHCSDSTERTSTTTGNINGFTKSSLREILESTDDTNNDNNNSNNVTLNLNLNNTINTVNHISIPINTSNHNSVNIQITGGSTTTTDTKTGNGFINDTGKATVIKVPYPVPIPIPAPPSTTTCRPPNIGPDCEQPTLGCCIVVRPCIQPCNPFHHVCSEQCSSNYMYTPLNPCAMGCQKRLFSIGRSCSISGYCRQSLNACSGCNMDDFYTTYGGYQQCGGCFY